MPGINELSKARQEENEARAASSAGLSLWLSDGDIAVVSPVATGKDGDERLGDFYMHSVPTQGFPFGKQTFCPRSNGDVTCIHCDAGIKRTHRFGLWVYAHYVDHLKQSDKKDRQWEAFQTKGGTTKYKETINGFRVFDQTFGRAEYLWAKLVEVYSEHGALNIVKLKISRTGTKTQTQYDIQGTAAKVEIPEKDEFKSLEELIPIREFFAKKAVKEPKAPKAISLDGDDETVVKSGGDDDDIL